MKTAAPAAVHVKMSSGTESGSPGTEMKTAAPAAVHVKMSSGTESGSPGAKEVAARAALHDLGLEIADRWASGFKNRPTQQLILQKIIEPAVRHILNTMFPWIVGMAVLFLVLLICTVVTCVIVLRSGSVATGVIAAVGASV